MIVKGDDKMSVLEKLEDVMDKYLEYEKIVIDNENKERQIEQLKYKRESEEEQKTAGESVVK